MAYSEEAYNYANEILEKRREYYALKTLDQLEKIRSTIPGFVSLEREKRSTGILRMKAKLSGDDQEAAILKSGIDEINNKMEQLLNTYGFSKDDLNEMHYCSICNDTGFKPDGSSCICRVQLLSEYELSKIKEVSPLSLSSFDSFSLDMYSGEIDPEFDMSPRENMEYVLERCHSFVNDFPNGKNLLMMGSAGLGKTHLALSIADCLLKKKYDTVYCSCSNIFGKIDEERADYSRHSDTLDRLKSCTLLVLDDLGSEYTNNNVRSLIYDIINSRLSSGISTIVTTNFIEEKQIMTVYGEKVSSRLLGNYEILPFFGDDIRKKNNL